MSDSADHRSWFGRNWKWAVPTGGCLLLIVFIVVFAGSLFVGVTSMFKDSTPYKDAFSQAQTNEYVIQALGEPIESDGMISGNINYSGDEGHAEFSIPIKGPNGQARIMVDADKSNDLWTYKRLEVILDDTGEVIELKDTDSVDF